MGRQATWRGDHEDRATQARPCARGPTPRATGSDPAQRLRRHAGLRTRLSQREPGTVLAPLSRHPGDPVQRSGESYAGSPHRAARRRADAARGVSPLLVVRGSPRSRRRAMEDPAGLVLLRIVGPSARPGRRGKGTSSDRDAERSLAGRPDLLRRGQREHHLLPGTRPGPSTPPAASARKSLATMSKASGAGTGLPGPLSGPLARSSAICVPARSPRTSPSTAT